jgi:YbgC/YbaW family acyl-CoA thioester hydrolase
MPEPASITIQRRVEWSDTDASGYWHNVAAFRMIEWAETALLDSLGIVQEVYGRLPRVHVSAEFKGRLSHRDLIEITLRVEEVGRSSLTYEVDIAHEGARVAEARCVVVLVDERGKPTSWDAGHRELLLSGGPQPSERLVSG